MRTVMADIITVNDLVEVYADGTKAVDGISFDVREGEFFGFLGPNGAGKSTTIKILTTLLRKTSGSATVAGYDIDKHPDAIRKLIGVENQETVVESDLTGRENLILQGHFQQLHGDALDRRVDELLKLVELTDVASKRAGHYSGGMKKRLDLASALVHSPKVIFLDEPTTGLDPQSRAAIWEYLEKLNREEGITIFLTTQYMEEADKLCRQLAIIDHGKIVSAGSPAQLKSEVAADSIKLVLENDTESKEQLNARAKEMLAKINGVMNVITSEDGLTVYAKNAGFIIADIVRAFDSNKIHLTSVSFSSPTLDDIFLHHTGRRIRTEDVNKSNAPPTMFGRRRR
jgi:ABC-2 type transport system ATP-binding protein